MLRALETSDEHAQASGLMHRVYLPPGWKASERYPAVMMVHGRAGNSQSMWIFSRALQEIKPVVLSPEAPLADPLGGYSWWMVGDAPREKRSSSYAVSEDDLQLGTQKLTAFIASLPELYGVDLSRLYAFGFSQGAAIVSTLALREPELFKGVAMLAGFIPRIVLQGGWDLGPHELPPFFIAHGTKDLVIPFTRAEEARDTLGRLGAKVSFHSDDVGHKIGSAGIKALQRWCAEVIGGPFTA